MLGKSLFALVAAFLVGIALTTQLVLGQGQAPAGFSGTVNVNGVPAADGTSVVAKINNVVYGSTSVSNGRYIIYIEDPNNNNAGKTIQFFVSNEAAQPAIFTLGEPRELDLSVTVPSSPPSNPPSSSTPSSGGGGGGGGGVSTPKNESKIVNESAQQQLIASAVENALPPLPESPARSEVTIPESAGSTVEASIKQGGGGFGAITGFLVAIPGKLTKTGVAVIVVLALAIAFFVYKKKRSKSPKGAVEASK